MLEELESLEAESEEVGMTEDELCAYIEERKRNSMGYMDTLRDDRVAALDFYMGEATGLLSPPEVDGRSSVVSTDLRDTVEWIMPSMMRIFAGTDNVVSFEPTKAGQEKGASDATIYCNYTLHKRNRGFNIIHDAIKSALIQRIAFVKVWNETETDEKEERYENLSEEQFSALQSCPDVDIVDIEAAIIIDPMMPPMINVTVKRSMDRTVIKIKGVPQEELYVDGEAKTDDDATCFIHEREITISDLIALGYDEEEVEEIPSYNNNHNLARDDINRRNAVGLTSNMGNTGKGAMRTVMLQECYLKVDFDGDNIAEWRMIHKAGDVILKNETCDGHPFAACSVLLMPYSYVGLSVYDLLKDITRIKTALRRQMLDNLYLINNARTEVLEGKVNLDDLLNPRPGGLVRVKQVGAMREIMPTPVAGQALQAIDYFDRERQRATGVSEFSSATGPESINKSSGIAVDLLQSQAKERIELMARVVGEGFITRLYRLILKCALQHKDSHDQIYIGGSEMQIDPREWAEQYNMTVSVGLGTQSRAAQVGQWNSLIQTQQSLMGFGIVRPEHLAASARSMIEAMGHKDVGQYMVDTNKEPIQPPQPPPDPNMMLVQIEQTKAQFEQQKAVADHQLKQQEMVQEEKFKAQDDARTFALEKYKIDSNRQLELEKAAISAQTAKEIEVIKIQGQAALSGQLDQVKSLIEAAKASSSVEDVAMIIDSLDKTVNGAANDK